MRGKTMAPCDAYSCIERRTLKIILQEVSSVALTLLAKLPLYSREAMTSGLCMAGAARTPGWLSNVQVHACQVLLLLLVHDRTRPQLWLEAAAREVLRTAGSKQNACLPWQSAPCSRFGHHQRSCIEGRMLPQTPTWTCIRA